MLRLTKYFILIFLFTPCIAIAQNVSEDTTIQKQPEIQKDTIIIYRQIPSEDVIKNYEQIIEKTNRQMSLWWNPYGVLIAALGILFAILAIIAAIIIYWQSEGAKKLIGDSLAKYETSLEKLTNEKDNLLKSYKKSTDNLLLEYKEKVKNIKGVGKTEMEEMISKLEVQKSLIDTQIHTYQHSGFGEKDITEDYSVNQSTTFYAKISFNEVNQRFIIYFRILTTDNRQFWIGFSGDEKNEIYQTSNEYTRSQVYNSKEVIIQENITSIFQSTFSKIDVQPLKIDRIRLRGSSTDLREITFSYKIT